MTKTVSARIPEKLHEKIVNRCNELGCSVNEFLNASIELAIIGRADFVFGEPEDECLEQLNMSAKD
jgi:hypothetical protein